MVGPVPGPPLGTPREDLPLSNDESNEIARKYDTIAYAAQSNAQSHPAHLATVAQLLGLMPPPVATCRVLEVGCSDGANLLPMAVSLPGAQFVGCDLSGQAIALARRAVLELDLSNVALVQCDLAMLPDDFGTFDYIVAHGVYSWVPAAVRDALLALVAKRLARNGVLRASVAVIAMGDSFIDVPVMVPLENVVESIRRRRRWLRTQSHAPPRRAWRLGVCSGRTSL